ncbi:helix-turn-helix domain-containing protein [Streptomyces sp. NPDC020917]|uniref:helix-turn-helix domain-containing protein n=1 Tax=Streptomyces sp. NPDC020917 TaxID=3365102 RepID=UPI0037B31881
MSSKSPGSPDRRDDAAVLGLLGLDAEQDAVYRLLVDRPDSTSAALAVPGTDAAAVARILLILVDRGLAGSERHPDGPRYRATPPVLALGPLLEARRSVLRRAEHLVTELAERHHASQSKLAGAPIEVLTGAAAIRRRILAMQQGARHQVRALVPAMAAPAAISLKDNFEEAERDSMLRGVRIRSVLERAWLERPVFGPHVADLAAEGQEISVVESLPLKLVIADDDTALLPLDPERDEAGEPVALVVHRSGLLTALISLFEQHFAQGWPLSGGAAGAADDEPAAGGTDGLPDAVDRQILALLHIGLTDAAIARQLGMGRRTVQRRLHALMTASGAVTRFQLGVHAHASGWLTP